MASLTITLYAHWKPWFKPVVMCKYTSLIALLLVSLFSVKPFIDFRAKTSL